MKILHTVIFGLSLFLTSLAIGETTLAISKVSSEATPNTREMTLKYKESPQVINVDKNASLTEKDVKSASLVDGDDVVVDLVLNDSGREKFAKLTRESRGKAIAIIIDGSLVTAPMIREELAGGNLQIAENLDKKAAERFVAAINKNSASKLPTK